MKYLANLLVVPEIEGIFKYNKINRLLKLDVFWGVEINFYNNPLHDNILRFRKISKIICYLVRI